MTRRANIKLLEQATSATPAVVELLSTARIVPSRLNVRRTFDAAKMAELRHSIINFGLQNPICVRSLGLDANRQETYEIVHGERRWRAFRDLGICQIDAIVWDVGELSDTDVIELSLIENLIREDLNPIEEVEGILKVLSMNLQIPEDALVQVLHQLNNEISRQNKPQVNGNVAIHSRRTSEPTFTRAQVQAILDRISGSNKKISIFTLVSHRLPLLRLPFDLDQAVRQKVIEPSKALLLGRVKDDDQRAKLLQEVCEQDLSVREIKSRIADLKTNLAQNRQTSSESKETRIKSLSDTLGPTLLEQTDQVILQLLDTLHQIQATLQQLKQGGDPQNIKQIPKVNQLKKIMKSIEEAKQQVERWVDIQETPYSQPKTLQN